MASNGNRNVGILVLMAAAGAVFGALVAYVKLAPADKVPNDLRKDAPISGGSPSSQQNSPTPKGDQVSVWIPTAQGEDVALREERVDLPKGENPMVFSVNRFLAEAKITESAARLLSVDVKGSVAELYFNADFNQTVGSSDEEVLLKGLRQTMGQFSGIEKITFYADGQPMETLGGVELNGGLTVIH